MISRDRAYELRAIIEQAVTSLEDESALNSIELFSKWKTNTSYAVDDRIRYNNVLYKCLQAHTSQDDWIPTDAVSLWTEVLIPDPEEIPEWVQPDSTNPYMLGDKVTHNDKTWESTIDNNVWEPGVYGWNEVA